MCQNMISGFKCGRHPSMASMAYSQLLYSIDFRA